MASRNHSRTMDESNRCYPGQGRRHPKIASNSNCTTHRSRPKPSLTVSLHPTDDTTNEQNQRIPRITDRAGTPTMHLHSRPQDTYLRVLTDHASRPRLDEKRCHGLLRPNHSQHRSHQQPENGCFNHGLQSSWYSMAKPKAPTEDRKMNFGTVLPDGPKYVSCGSGTRKLLRGALLVIRDHSNIQCTGDNGSGNSTTPNHAAHNPS
jgi:hypothetical protein